MWYIRGTIIKHRKKGNTLIELVTAISITSILTTAALSAFIFFIRDFKKEVHDNQQQFYINEAFRYIENEILKGNKEIKINSDSIEIKRYLRTIAYEEIDYIKKVGNNMIIEHTRMGYHEATNVFLRNITGFSASNSSGVISLEIIDSKGEKYKKCISTQYIR